LRSLATHAAKDGLEEIREAATPERTAEKVAQIAIFDMDTATARRSSGPPAPVETTGIAARALPLLPTGPQLIVFTPFLRVSQHLMGLIDLFEALLGLFVARVNVGVIFASQTTVGFLDLLLSTIAPQANGSGNEVILGRAKTLPAWELLPNLRKGSK
jgi:hypothetical protein